MDPSVETRTKPANENLSSMGLGEGIAVGMGVGKGVGLTVEMGVGTGVTIGMAVGLAVGKGVGLRISGCEAYGGWRMCHWSSCGRRNSLD